METQVCGAEVRRIHVIYFLSRKGHIEHPHLIRVHHLSRNGVHLRDVKRWLSELRGKEMADAFAWSYKRRYKKGYVWQDLLDDDLITPISDNEYVLKGSEISFSNSSSRDDSLSQEQSPTTKEEISQQKEKEEEAEGPQETKLDEPGKAASPEMDRESLSFGSEKSTLTDDLSSTKLEDDNHEHHSRDRFKVEILHEEEDDKTEDHSFCVSSTPTPTATSSSKGNNVNTEEKVSTPDSVSSARSATFKRSKSYSNGASVLFRNLISCGAADTNDSALVTINKPNKSSQSSSLSKQNHHIGNELILTKGDKFGGSQRVFETSLNRQSQYASRRSFDGVRNPAKSKTEFNNQKAIPPFRPINGPQCSQCGKPFKPEKLHGHMKSCKGMKAMMAKCTRIPSAATFDDKCSERSSEFAFDNDSFSSYYLMRGQ